MAFGDLQAFATARSRILWPPECYYTEQPLSHALFPKVWRPRRLLSLLGPSPSGLFVVRGRANLAGWLADDLGRRRAFGNYGSEIYPGRAKPPKLRLSRLLKVSPEGP